MAEKMSHVIGAAASLCAKLLPTAHRLGAHVVNANRGQIKADPDKIGRWE
jgi:hypothetical protein